MSKKTIGTKYEYELTNRLGKGAFAEVYKGRNKQTGEIVAIKVIQRSILARYGDDMLKQIHNEILVLQQLVTAMKLKLCPFINKIFDCLETTNHIYIILEFCNQGTLLDYIQKNKKKVGEEDAVMILFQITSALAFLAENNTAHRDIKPENIFVKDGVYKLGDFGFAGQKQLYQTHLGTYPYMAPEFFNSKNYDSGVDVWALGCMFHEMLFGEIYFIGNTQYEVSMKIMNKAYVIRPDQQCSSEARDLLPLMIEKDKSKRISAKQVLEHPLFNKVKASAAFQKIMTDEREYMEKFSWGNPPQNQQPNISDQSKYINPAQEQNQNASLAEIQSNLQNIEIDSPQKGQQQIPQNYTGQVTKIVDGVNSIRNAILFFVQLAEFLQSQFINECRYDIFYILKQSLIKITRLKEQLDEQTELTFKDNIEFKDIQSQAWKVYYSNGEDKYNKQREELTHERAIILKHYIDYFNYINNHTQMNYQEHIQNLSTMTNLNLQDFIAPQLFITQMHSTISFFQNYLPQIEDKIEKVKVQKMILWMYLASHFDQVFDGTLVDIGQFLNSLDNNNIIGMKQAIQFQNK